jgi:hypothetical protein
MWKANAAGVQWSPDDEWILTRPSGGDGVTAFLVDPDGAILDQHPGFRPVRSPGSACRANRDIAVGSPAPRAPGWDRADAVHRVGELVLLMAGSRRD